LIMSLDKMIFGYEQFNVLDSLLFQQNNSNTNSNLVVNLSDSFAQNNNGQTNVIAIEECTSTTVLITWQGSGCGSNFQNNLMPGPGCSISMTYNNCIITGLDWGSEGNTGGGPIGGGSPTGGGGSGGGSIPHVYPCIPGPQSVNGNNIGPGGPLPTCPPPTGGPGYNPVSGVQNITNNVTNPCLNEVYNHIKNNGFKSKLGIFLQTFAGNPNINVNIVGSTTMSPNDYAYTDYNSITNTYTIQLNLNNLPHCSQEFISDTYFHEIVHVYLKEHIFDYDFESVSAHTEMLNNYFTALVNATLTSYPNISPLTAFAITWDGLTNMRTNNPAEAQLRSALKQNLMNKINLIYPGTDASMLETLAEQHQVGGAAGTRNPNCN
jgi:hypothetical protein